MMRASGRDGAVEGRRATGAAPSLVAAAWLTGWLLAALAGCAADPPPAAPPAPDTAPAAALPLPVSSPAAGTEEPGRVVVTGGHPFDSRAAVRCGAAPAVGSPPRSRDLKIELDPDEPLRPMLLLTVPDLRGDGTYPATLSLRLDSDNGTFTESIGEARVEVAQVDAGVFTGSFAAIFSGAAGEGEAIGRFTGCR